MSKRVIQVSLSPAQNFPKHLDSCIWPSFPLETLASHLVTFILKAAEVKLERKIGKVMHRGREQFHANKQCFALTFSFEKLLNHSSAKWSSILGAHSVLYKKTARSSYLTPFVSPLCTPDKAATGICFPPRTTGCGPWADLGFTEWQFFLRWPS